MLTQKATVCSVGPALSLILGAAAYRQPQAALTHFLQENEGPGPRRRIEPNLREAFASSRASMVRLLARMLQSI